MPEFILGASVEGTYLILNLEESVNAGGDNFQQYFLFALDMRVQTAGQRPYPGCNVAHSCAVIAELAEEA